MHRTKAKTKSKTRTKAKRVPRENPDVAHWRNHVASCLECGCVVGIGTYGLVCDVPHWQCQDLTEAIGVDVVLRQGISAGPPWQHHCPAGRRDLVEVKEVPRRERRRSRSRPLNPRSI